MNDHGYVMTEEIDIWPTEISVAPKNTEAREKVTEEKQVTWTISVSL